MKIFYKRDFQRVLEQLKAKEKIIENQKVYIIKLDDVITDKEKKIQELNIVNNGFGNVIDKQASENYDLHEKIKQEQASKGGLTKENNKLKLENEQLKKEIEDLNKKITDLQSDRYLIRKIPSGRTPNINKTKVSSTMKSSVRKYMKEAFDE